MKDYVRPNSSTGKKGRKILIFDINMEYNQFKILDISDVKKFTQQSKIEVRRVLPIKEDGTKAKLDEYVTFCEHILDNYKGGLLLLEDINKYLLSAKNQHVIGSIVTCRHLDLDIVLHLQSLAKVTPDMWENCNQLRFHYQLDNVDRIKSRVPNYELIKLTECLVEYKYLYLREQYFYCYMDNDNSKITGNFSLQDFQKAVEIYARKLPREKIKYARRFGNGKEAQNKGMKVMIIEMADKYYGGL